MVPTHHRAPPGHVFSSNEETLQWSFDWIETIKTVIPIIEPAILVMNAGHWAHNLDQRVDELLAAIQSIQNQTRSIWKTTTPSREKGTVEPNQEATDHRMCQAFQDAAHINHNTNTTALSSSYASSCLNITWWLQNTSSQLYVDQLHFREPLYRMMNEQLLLETMEGLVTMPSNYTRLDLSELGKWETLLLEQQN